MSSQTSMAGSEARAGYWRRVLRPLVWWFLFVLVLLGIHQHQVWIERTRFYCSVTMYETNVVSDAVGLLDGHEIHVGDRISLGWHTLTITEPKAEPFTTNFSAWYGRNDLGQINLKRAMGTLDITANPPAASIFITGPEFSQELHDSTGTKVSVPTDLYTVTAQYPRWAHSQNVMVSENGSGTCAFNPKFGALHLTCNHDGATYRLQLSGGQTADSGDLPATVSELPVGKYQLIVHFHRHEIQKAVQVEAETTNEVPMDFALGGVRLESTPKGASVYAPDGNCLGQTPLDLADLAPQPARFQLSLADYEPATLAVDVIADTTVTVRTNLMSVQYDQALRRARQYENMGNYKAMVEAVGEMLRIKPDDPEALALQAKATEELNSAKLKTTAPPPKPSEPVQTPKTAAVTKSDQMNRFRDYFTKLMSGIPYSTEATEQDLKVSGNVDELRSKIADALSKSVMLKFAIEQNEEPVPGSFMIQAKQAMIEGYRRCYIVGGQTADGEVTIMFKVMEYTWPSDLALSALLHRPSDDKAIPIAQSNLASFVREDRRALGVKLVTERIQQVSRQTTRK